MYFQVSLDVDGKNAWKECFSVHGVKLPLGYFFGATAATGELAGKILTCICMEVACKCLNVKWQLSFQ